MGFSDLQGGILMSRRATFRISSALILSIPFLSGCASMYKKMPGDHLKISLAIAATSTDRMAKALAKCLEQTARPENEILTFRCDFAISDKGASIEGLVIQPGPAASDDCIMAAKTAGQANLKEHWEATAPLYVLGDHQIISKGSIFPKIRFEVTDSKGQLSISR